MLSASCRLLPRGVRDLLSLGPLTVTPSRGTVIVERWWKVSLAKEGKEPYLHPRRHRIFRKVEDRKHVKKDKMELILTQTVHKLGNRGQIVLVDKATGRNKLLAQGLAVYPSPENKQMFEEENKMMQDESSLKKQQTWTGELTVNYLKNSRLEVGMKNNVKWELNKEIVCRNFLKNLGVVVPLEALKIPEESITRWGEYWCEVTVNGIDTVRLPMDVVNFEREKTKRYKYWLSQQAAKNTNEPTSED
ncbi:large ribosomal subunit protein bL9m [Pelobates fuscus]|uniref:large ribosomal subunit protein bL9m n=1 Tax=Pelobates fuscus TaxID=191477 RepID=UPI002FE4382D